MFDSYRASAKKWIADRPFLKKISIVGLIEVLGGVILTLVLGIQAWAGAGRKYRLCVGALAAGVTIGVFVYRCHPNLLSFLNDPSKKIAVAFGGVPILLLALTFFLESLRSKLP
jgi:hypothetical protein